MSCSDYLSQIYFISKLLLSKLLKFIITKLLLSKILCLYSINEYSFPCYQQFLVTACFPMHTHLGETRPPSQFCSLSKKNKNSRDLCRTDIIIYIFNSVLFLFNATDLGKMRLGTIIEKGMKFSYRVWSNRGLASFGSGNFNITY